jgi:hypothetical protein
MSGTTESSLSAKVLVGVAVPSVVLAAALVRVDPVLLGGAGVAFAATFGVAYAYARYVDFDIGPADGGRPPRPRERPGDRR